MNSHLKGEIARKHSVRCTSVGGCMGLKSTPALILVGKEAQAHTERTGFASTRILDRMPGLATLDSPMCASHRQFFQEMSYASTSGITSTDYCCGIDFRITPYSTYSIPSVWCVTCNPSRPQCPGLRVKRACPSANYYHFTPILPAVVIYPSKVRWIIPSELLRCGESDRRA